jgi:hypothetical protein
MRRKADTGVVAGAVALFAAFFVLGAAIARATFGLGGGPTDALASRSSSPTATAESSLLSAEQQLDVVATATPGLPALRPGSEALPSDALSLAVERAPFDPDRRAPSQRYLLPNEIVPPRREAPPPERPAAPQFQVLGTVYGASGQVAVVRHPDNSIKVLTVGQELDGYRVSEIVDGAVVMTGRGWDLTFAVADARPGDGRPQRDEFGRIVQPNGGQNRGQQQDRAQQNRAQAAAAQAAAQRAGVLRALLDDMREKGEAIEGGVQWRIEGDVIVPGPAGTPVRGRVVAPAPTPEMMFFRRPAPPDGGA